MIDSGRIVVAVFYLAVLSVVFIGMSAVVLPIVYGTPTFSGCVSHQEPKESQAGAHEPLWSIVPPLVFAAVALVLGLYLPQSLSDLLHNAAMAVGAE